MIARELLVDRSSDAVVLQECSPELIEFIKVMCDTSLPALHSHCSQPAREITSSKMCHALTCIVSPHILRPLADVLVHAVDTAEPKAPRAFATALLPDHGLILSSVHVRHASGHASDQPSNVANISAAEAALKNAFRSACSEGAGSVRCLLAVGDFNGATDEPTSTDAKLAASSPCDTLIARLDISTNSLALIEKDGDVLHTIDDVSVSDGEQVITSEGTTGMVFEEMSLKLLRYDGSKLIFSMETKKLTYAAAGTGTIDPDPIWTLRRMPQGTTQFAKARAVDGAILISVRKSWALDCTVLGFPE